MSTKPVRQADGLLLDLKGWYIFVIEISSQFTIRFAAQRSDRITLDIYEPFTLDTQAGHWEFEPMARERLGPALTLVYQKADSLLMREQGPLELIMADGSVLRVPSSDEFESWRLVPKQGVAEPDGWMIVAAPDGLIKFGID